MPRYDWVDDGYYITEKRDLGTIRQVLLITMLLNFLAMAIKIGAGIVVGSLSVIADGLDSFFDGLSNVIGLAGLYAAGKPPDAEHPYGYRKFETAAALIISFLLFLTCWQLLMTAWLRLRAGSAPDVNGWVIAAMIVSMLIQAGTSYYELRAGRRLKSELLVADALHTRASTLVSFSVLVGLVFVRLGFPRADPLFAMFVALVIAKIGVDILRENIPILVDRAAVDPRHIAEVVGSVSGVESFHRVRSRGAGGSAAVDLHVRVSPDKTVQEGDTIATEIRRLLLELDGVSDVTVHLEAQRSAETNAADIFAVVKHTADQLGLTVHESWAHRTDGRLYVEVHVGVDPRLTLGEAHNQVEQLAHTLRQRLPEISEVRTHIEMATRQVDEGDRVPAELESRVRMEIEEVVSKLPTVNQPHNIAVRHSRIQPGGYFVSLECTVAPDTPVSEAHQLSKILEQELTKRLEGVAEVLVHMEPPGSS